MLIKYDYIVRALREMASRCDGARQIDGVGFNSHDASRVRSLLRFDRWSDKQAKLALVILGNYKNTQLPALGIDIEELWARFNEENGRDAPGAGGNGKKAAAEQHAEPSSFTAKQLYKLFNWSPPKPLVTKRGEMLMLMTLVSAGGSDEQRFWGLWNSAAKSSLKGLGVSVRKDGGWKVNWWCGPQTFYELNALNGKRVKISTDGLLPFQRDHVGNLVAALKHFGTALDGSQTGAGKSISAMVAARNLGLPTFVVCPARLPPTWRRWSAHAGHPIIDAVGYELLKCGNTPHVRKADGSFEWLLPKKALIIFDEVHRAGGLKNASTGRTPRAKLRVAVKFKNKQNKYLADHPKAHVTVAARKVRERVYNLDLHDYLSVSSDAENRRVVLEQFEEVPAHNFKRWTLESDLLDSAVRQGYRVLLLSATAADTSKRMSAIGAALGLFPERSDFYNWSFGFGCRYKDVFIKGGGGKSRKVLDFRGGPEDMQKLHDAIYGTGRGSRIRAEDIDGFPDGQVEPVLLDLEESREIYEKILAAVDSANDDEAHHLANRMEVRQAAELAKLEEAVVRGRDILDESCAPVFFVCFKETLRALQNTFKDFSVVHGDQNEAERVEQLSLFESNKNPGMISTYGAGGTGADMHDLHGRRRICVGVSMPEWALLFLQSLGRTRRTGALSPSLFIVLFADCWPERQIYENVQAKVLNINTLNDGDLAVTR